MGLKFDHCFSNSQSQVKWRGERVVDVNEFEGYLQGPVFKRLFDVEHKETFVAELRALTTTEMASDTLTDLLAAESNRDSWEVGEALAECLLEEEHEVKWPWNMERDKRTPKASLPGADLVGFITEGKEVSLLLGEVKTSSDKSTPPNVMYGQSGMVHELDKLAFERGIHLSLFKWLHARCKQSNHLSLFYQQAVAKYLKSGGRALVIFGILLRDTEPHELDLKNRAQKLSNEVVAPTRVELVAWYLPRLIEHWPKILTGGLE